MSRFANPTATERFVLGPCECAGKPHDDDWMDLRTELGATDVIALEEGDAIARMKLLITGWNLHGDDGQVAPIDGDYLGRLYADTFETLNVWLTDHVRISTLPNASGAPSRNGSKGSASRIRTISKRG
jgi:hypothetical protein